MNTKKEFIEYIENEIERANEFLDTDTCDNSQQIGVIDTLEMILGDLKKEPKISPDDFRESIYEIAYGDNAINKGYTDKHVIKKMQELSDSSYESVELLSNNYSSIDDFEEAKKEFLERLGI